MEENIKDKAEIAALFCNYMIKELFKHYDK